MNIDGVFVFIGYVANTETLVNTKVNLNKRGEIITDEDLQTSIPGVYAAGDVKDKTFRQAVTAAGMGCMAALEAEKFLSH